VTVVGRFSRRGTSSLSDDLDDDVDPAVVGAHHR
jgi:hypothetical protein